jgi:predicted ATP-dependent serine protease
MVVNLDQRLKEAEKLGFEKAYIPKTKKVIKSRLDITQISNINEIV